MKNIFLIIGPSGSGKSFLQKKLIKLGFSNIISATTRAMREGEKNNVDYVFKNKDNFFNTEYIEWDQVGDNYYGTPKDQFLKNNKIAHVIEPFGAKKIIDSFADQKDFNIKIIFLNINKEDCIKNLERNGPLSKNDLDRLKRDEIDSIPNRLNETKLNIDFETTSVDYNINHILGLLK